MMSGFLLITVSRSDDLLVRLEVGVGDGDDLDAQVAELGARPAIWAVAQSSPRVVHDDGGCRLHRLDLVELLRCQVGRRSRGWILTVRTLAEHLALQLLQSLVGLLGRCLIGWGGSGLAWDVTAGQGRYSNNGDADSSERSSQENLRG